MFWGYLRVREKGCNKCMLNIHLVFGITSGQGGEGKGPKFYVLYTFRFWNYFRVGEGLWVTYYMFSQINNIFIFI